MRSAALIAVLLFGCSPRKKAEPPKEVSVSAPDGLPRTLDELNAWYAEPPAGQNAATFYTQGFDALHLEALSSSELPLLGKGKLPPLGASLPPQMKSSLAALLDSNTDALQFFAQGAACEQSRYSADLSMGFDTTLPHCAKVKSASQLAELAALLHAQSNDAGAAGNDLLTGLHLARSLEAEPVLLSQLMRAGSIAISLSALEQTVNRITLPAENLSALAKTLQAMEESDARGEGFTRCLVGERAMSMALLESRPKLLQAVAARPMHLTLEQRQEITAHVQKAPNLAEEQQFFEETFQQLLTARKASFPGRLETDALVRQRLAEAAEKKLDIITFLLPGLGGRTAKEAECLAQLRLASAAVALEQSRAVHHNYPDKLPELTAVDPFDGQPLRYRKKGAGYVLYSIGSDLKDNSGQRKNGKEGDIVFQVLAPGEQRK